MDDAQTLRSMVRDDAYRVVRVLADGPSGKTELVTLDGEGPLVRKHIPLTIANAAAWAAAMEVDEPLLPRIETLYRMPDELVVVYDYVPGESLSALMAREGHLSGKRAVGIVCDVCRAVSALHGMGVVHRDITPGNVIVADDGAHLVDLGIARQEVKGRNRDTNTLGTWGYAAPEQFGFAQTDARSDVYSLGRLVGYLLSGVQPDSDTYERALADTSLVDAKLADVARRAAAFEPSARYQSADELAQALRRALESSQTQVVPPRADAASERQPEPVAELLRSPRKLTQAPIPILAVGIVAWAVLFLAFYIVVYTVAWAILYNEPPWELAQYVMSVVVCGGIALIAYDIYRAMTWRGPYAHKEGSLRHLLSKICIIVLAVVILVVLVAVVFGSFGLMK